jgi:hypothetical protein
MMLAARPQPGRVGTIATSLAADVEAGTAQRCEPDGFLDVSPPPEDSEPALSVPLDAWFKVLVIARCDYFRLKAGGLARAVV